MTQSNCIIIHACPANTASAKNPETRTYDKHWLPRTKQELTAHGIPTATPLMPHPWEPVYEEYKEEFEKYPVSENMVLIGHSGGCAFLVRWLGDTKQPIRKLVLVAPWNIEYDDIIKKAFYDYPIDSTITSRVSEIILFTSDNEKEDGKRSLHMFHDAFGGTIVELSGKGHYTLGDMGTEAFPELIYVVIGNNCSASKVLTTT